MQYYVNSMDAPGRNPARNNIKWQINVSFDSTQTIYNKIILIEFRSNKILCIHVYVYVYVSAVGCENVHINATLSYAINEPWQYQI